MTVLHQLRVGNGYSVILSMGFFAIFFIQCMMLAVILYLNAYV